MYNYLEPLYNDYRKLKRKNRQGGNTNNSLTFSLSSPPSLFSSLSLSSSLLLFLLPPHPIPLSSSSISLPYSFLSTLPPHPYLPSSFFSLFPLLPLTKIYTHTLFIFPHCPEFELIHVDEFIDELLRDDRVCDIILPRIQKRTTLEQNEQLEPRVSALDDDLSDEESEEEEEEPESDHEKDRHNRRSPSPSRRHHDRNRERRRSRSRSPGYRRSVSAELLLFQLL